MLRDLIEALRPAMPPELHVELENRVLGFFRTCAVTCAQSPPHNNVQSSGPNVIPPGYQRRCRPVQACAVEISAARDAAGFSLPAFVDEYMHPRPPQKPAIAGAW